MLIWIEIVVSENYKMFFIFIFRFEQSLNEYYALEDDADDDASK